MTNLLKKVDKNRKYFGLFREMSFLSRNVCSNGLGHFGKKWATFDSIIWSHCNNTGIAYFVPANQE